MPSLDIEKTNKLAGILTKFLEARKLNELPVFLAAGGSAAVFRVDLGSEVRAFKVFDPRFFDDSGGDAERRRLKLQEKLISHSCPSLVQIHSVFESYETAIVEMEYCDWPQLGKVLPSIPDEAVLPLILQLVEAVKFLASRDIVHRDIKPENIHVSPDFAKLKLLDTGVVRTFDDFEDAATTDNDLKRPFLATAQYSSPEYLFRLDPPSPRLWEGLNITSVR